MLLTSTMGMPQRRQRQLLLLQQRPLALRDSSRRLPLRVATRPSQHQRREKAHRTHQRQTPWLRCNNQAPVASAILSLLCCCAPARQWRHAARGVRPCRMTIDRSIGRQRFCMCVFVHTFVS
jgi:hypothetical protein